MLLRSSKSRAIVLARAAESSQLVAYCAVWIGTLSVWPSMRTGALGNDAANVDNIDMEASRSSAEPDAKKPISLREMTRPSGVIRVVALPGGMPPPFVCERSR